MVSERRGSIFILCLPDLPLWMFAYSNFSIFTRGWNRSPIDTINGWPGLDRYSLLYPLLEFRQETISSVEKVGKLFELFSSSVKRSDK